MSASAIPRVGRARHRPADARLALGALGAAALLALTGCTPGEVADAPEAEQVQLTPSGDRGSWFLDAYSSGVEQSYATSNTVCGVTEDVVIELQESPGYTYRVLARQIPTGRILWEADALCWEGSVFGDEVAVAVEGGTSQGWSMLDAGSGQTTRSLSIENGAYGASPIAEVDGVLVLRSADDSLAGFTGSERVWSVARTGNGDVTPLGDGHIGIRDGQHERAKIIDGRTGETVMERDTPYPRELTWASDGFVLEVNETDPEYAFYDLHGDEVDRTDGTSQYPFVPSPRHGVTFSVQDHVAAGPTVGVDADGRPALFEGDGGRDFTATGEIEELPDSIISLQGVSAGGELLLFDDEANDRIVVLDPSGDEVFVWSLPASGSVRVESGYIVLQSDFVTQVLLPPT